jgi:DNA-binding NtrC family response regulator
MILAALGSHLLPGNWRDLRRLAVRLVVQHQAGPLTCADIEAVLRGFGADSMCDLAAPRSRNAVPSRLSKQQLTRRKELERRLGRDFSNVESEMAKDGASLRVALERLLGDRDRAARAEKFLRNALPERWRVLRGG